MTTSKDTATIAALSVKLDGAIAQLGELKVQFNTFQSNFLRQDVYAIKHEELVKQVAINSNEIQNMKKDGDKSRYIIPAVTLILGGVMTFLIEYAITH